MKKLFFGFFTVAIMLLATSCQKDNDPGTEATISFSINIDDNAMTRAIGDGTSVDSLIYAVYDANGNIIKMEGVNENDQFSAKVSNGGAKINLSLPKNQQYIVAFWAQNKACKAYTTTDLKNVTIDYSNALNNDETRDAFFAVDTFVVKNGEQRTVYLKRPFAQINVGITKADFEAAQIAGTVINQSEVKIIGVANTLNLLSGAVSGDNNSYTFTSAKVPEEKLLVDTNADNTKDEFHYLSMSYILVDKTTVDLEYTFQPQSGNPIVLSDGLDNVPVKRNWRTNIVGTLLTGAVDFNIIIEPTFGGENVTEAVPTVTVNSQESLASALATAQNGACIILEKGEYTIPANAKNKTLNFAGIGNAAETVIKLESNSLGVLNGSDVTFENLTIESINDNFKGFQHVKTATYKNCIIKNQFTLYSDDSSKSITFEGCEFDVDGNHYNVWTYGTNATFNNCKFNCDAKAVLIYNEDPNTDDVVTFNNCEFNDNGGVNKAKAAIETGANHSTVKHTIHINKCIVNGFAVTENDNDPNHGGDSLGTNVWGNKCYMTRDNLNVFIDGTEVY